MKVYVPFFVISICMAIVLMFLYNPSQDFKVTNNIYSYSEESFAIINKKQLVLDRYYIYIDCHVGDKNFKEENISFYKNLSDCSLSIDKVNYLLKFFKNNDVEKMLEINFDYQLINEDNYKRVKAIIFDEKFESARFERYLKYDGEKRVLNVNLDHDVADYVDFKVVDKLSYLTVINKKNRLNSIDFNLSYCLGYYVFDEVMCNDFRLFLEELRSENVEYSIIKIFDKNDLFSEHSSGLAVDIKYDYELNNYVENLASKHGFILRYKSDYLNVTSYEEAGHFRYVGDKSTEIYELQVSLEEFVYFNS